MLKITEYEVQPQLVKIELEGKLVKKWVIELERLIEKHLMKKKKILIDCSRIYYIDEYGVKILNKYCSEVVKKVNCSLFIKVILGTMDNES